MNRHAAFRRLFNRLAAALLVLFFAVGIAGCGQKEPSKSSGKEQAVQKTVSQKVDRPDLPETPQSRIQEDLLAGKITEEQAVVLGLKAVFAPEDLPAEYKVKGSVEVKPSINAELQWISDNLDNMAPATRDKLEPFILPPTDPRSFFYPGNNAEDYVSKLSFLTAGAAYAAQEDTRVWDKVVYEVPDSSGKSVTIHYYTLPAASDAEKAAMKQRALQVREAIATAWPKFKELLRVEPDQSFDAYITDLREDASWGLAWWNSQTRRCEMSVHYELDGDKLKSTTAHELFHCFQLYIPHRFSLKAPEKSWLFEATATWAEHFVYPRANVEHRWLNYFFQSLYWKRVAFNGCHEYSNYPLFFFASDFLNDKDYVRRTLAAAKTKDVATSVMESMPDFADKYAKFAVYNWNKDPFLLYRDPPKFPSTGAYGASVGSWEFKGPDLQYYDELLRPGAMSYWHFTFDQDTKKINKVVFNLMVNISNPYFTCQALLKVGNEWVVEDWTGIKERSFCRERPGENLQEAVVIFANGDFRATLTFPFQVDTTQKCPHVLGGYTRITEKHQGEGMQSEIVYQTQEEIEYDPVQKAYVVKSMTASYSKNESMEGQMVLGMATRTSGSGSLRETYSEGEQPIKILEKPSETILMLQTDTKEKKWVTYTQTATVEYAGTESESWQDGPTGFWPKNIALTKEEIKSDRIKGRRVMQTTSEFGTKGELVIEFEYELK